MSLLSPPATASPSVTSAKVRSAAEPHGAGRPDLDARFGSSGYVPTAGQKRALASFAGKVRASWSQTGTAHSLVPVDRALSGPSDQAPDSVARGFLAGHRALFGLGKAEVDALRLTMSDGDAGVRFLRYQQVSEGRDVYGATVLVVVDGQGRVLTAGGSLVPDAGSAPAAALSAADAVDLAAEDVNPREATPGADRLSSRNGVVRFENTAAMDDYTSARPIRAELVSVATADGVRPAWKVQADVASNADYVELVDARTGEVLLRENQVTHDVQATVYQGDDPEAGGRSQIPLPSGWVSGVTTSGNNTNTYQDAEGDNSAQADDQPQAADQHFNYTWNDPWGASPDGDEADLPLSGANRDAVVTQLFYYTNWFHDYSYGLGFTETARNFQNDNFGNGGDDGDAVEAESDANFTGLQCKDEDNNDVKCLNNANFNTNGSDGTKPRMQMYVGDTNPGGAARRTQRANNRDTVIHEYTHGISGRIISDGNLAGGIQSKSLGEGWSDAFATSINNDPVYGEYNNGDYDTGIRGVAYDDDSLEYGDFSGDSEHNNGRIWAMNMWETRASLIAKYGFNTGKDKHERLMMLGMKFTPDSPSFHDARSGYLIADYLMHPTATFLVGQNACRIWNVYADNELGMTVSPDSDTANSGSITVSTETPDVCSPNAVIAAVAPTPEGTSIVFNGSGSTVGGDPGDTLSYAWDLDNDGQYDDAFVANPSRAYGQDGPRTVGLRVTNSGGYTDTASVAFSITNVAPAVDGNLSGSNAEGALVTLNATISDPGWLDPLTATVNWGDGTGTAPLTGSLENLQPNATLTASATHRYGDNGTFDVQVCGTDDDVSTCVTFPRFVSNVPPSVSLDVIAPIDEGQSVLVKGSFTDPGWLDTHVATIDAGDGNGPQAVPITKTEGGPGTPDSGTFSTIVPYGDDGVFTVTAKVSDDDGAFGATQRAVTVSNVGPTLTLDTSAAVDLNGTPTIITDVNSTVPFSSDATDPGSDDLTVTWDWDDGSPSPDLTETSLVNPPNIDPDQSPSVQPRDVTFQAQHQFGTACMYDMTVGVADDDGGTDSAGIAVAVLGNRVFAQNQLKWFGEFNVPGKRPFNPGDRTDAELDCLLDVVRAFSVRFSVTRPVLTHQQAAKVLLPPLLTPLLNARNELDASILAGWLDIADGSMKLDQKVSQTQTFSGLLLQAEAHVTDPSTPILTLVTDKLAIALAIQLDTVGEILP